MTPQEQVKMLREALVKARHNVPMGSVAYHSIGEALAATAPPLRWTEHEGMLCDGNASCDFASLDPAERAAVLDALNALHEKENARV